MLDPTPPATPDVPATPATTPVITKTDILGNAQAVYAGADSAATTEVVTGDRGNDLVPSEIPAAAPPATAPPATAPPATAPVVAAPLETPPVEPVRDDKGRFIPRERYNEVNEKRKTAEARVAELEGAAEAVKAGATGEYDFNAKEKEYAEFVIAGEVDRAIALRQEIRAAEQAQYTAVAQSQAAQVTQRASVQGSIEAINQSYEERFATTGIFDAESPGFNEPLLDDIKALYAGALQTGRYPDQVTAWQKSIESGLKIHGIADPAAPAPVAAPAVPPRVPSASARVEAIVGQPPSLAAAGLSGGAAGMTDTIDVNKMTDAEFQALPAATKARLRGDIM